MKASDLVFVGFNSRVIALNRASGEVSWEWRSPKGSGYVAVIVDRDRLIVSVDGYTYCLDPASGTELWFNALPGFGTGVPCLATSDGRSAQLHRLSADDDESRSSSS